MTNGRIPVNGSHIPWAETTPEFDRLWESFGVSTGGVPDLLSTMFLKQEQHMEAYGAISHTNPVPAMSDYGKLDNPVIQSKVREYAGYTVEELIGEAISGHLKNKPWKQTFKPVDRDAFLEELADAWHFFIEMHIYAGVSPEDVFKAYFKKALENDNRRATGY